MRKILSLCLFFVLGLLLALPVLAVPGNGRNAGFVTGIVINVDGDDYYLAGAPVDPTDPDSPTDVPGHYWVLAGSNKLVGKHYNTGPMGMPQGWSSDAPDGELLYIVRGIIDIWTLEKSEWYASRGYVHYHELVKVEDGTLHPSKVVWLKHTARTFFTLDRGPAYWMMDPVLYEHEVTPGVDYEFPNNYMNPYP